MLSGIQAQYVLHQLFLARINTRHGHAPGVEGDGAGDEFAEVEHMLIDTIIQTKLFERRISHSPPYLGDIPVNSTFSFFFPFV